MASACSTLTSCGMCLWDATIEADGIPEDLECMWCPATSSCLEASAMCPDAALFSNATRTDCPELQCHLAYISFNVYVCDATVLVGCWVNVAVLIFCVMYWMWLSAVRQKPWRHADMMRRAQMRWEGTAEGLIDNEVERDDVIDLSEDGETAYGGEVSGFLTPVNGRGNINESNDDDCQLCTQEGKECGWCFLARFAFLPFLIGTTTVCGNLLSTLLFSLRPNFYAPYVTSTTLFCVLFFACFYVIFMLPIAMTATWDPCFFRLAWMLKWRQMGEILPGKQAVVLEGETERETMGTKGEIELLPQAPSFFSNPTDYLRQSFAAAVGRDGGVSPAKSMTPRSESPTSMKSPRLSSKYSDHPHPNKIDAPSSPDLPPQAGSSQIPPEPLNLNNSTFHRLGLQAAGHAQATITQANEVVPQALLVSASKRNDIVEQEKKEMVLMRKDGFPLCVSGDDDPLIHEIEQLPAGLKPQLLAALNAEEDVVDEHVVWCYQPKVTHLIQHDMMFLTMNVAMVLFAAFIIVLANDEDLAPARVIGRANLHVAAFVVLSTSLFLSAMFLASCKRVYVLTTHNVLTLCHTIWMWSITSQPTLEMDCGLVSVYTEFGRTHHSYSWRRPRSLTRRMDALPTSQFNCIENVNVLIEKIHKFCPPITARVWRGKTEELNMEWRVHMGLTYLLLLLSVTSTHYSTVPRGVLALGIAMVALVVLGVFQKGMRQHLTNNQAVDTLSKNSKWIRSHWVAKECVKERNQSQKPDYDDILNSQTILHPRA